MALAFTKPVNLGFKAPEFQLIDVITGKKLTFEDVKGEKGTLIMFICNHCPYVKHVIHQLVQLGHDYIPKGIGVAAISSNDVNSYPDDSPELMKKLAAELSFPFPYLYDEKQHVAKDYYAECTPDFDLFDANDRCVYRGQLDGSRPGNNIPVTGKDLRKALDLILNNKPVAKEQTPSAGCSIKWKS